MASALTLLSVLDAACEVNIPTCIASQEEYSSILVVRKLSLTSIILLGSWHYT